VCAHCKRVYQAVPQRRAFDPICEGAVRAPKVCACGKSLVGEHGTARVICTACFIDAVHNGGSAPHKAS
jgi:hypothetical protein